MSESSSSATADALSFAPGAPNWVDSASGDVEASKRFYSGLFGWNAMDLGEEAGGYVMFTLGDKTAAAVGPLQEGQHPAWSVYFNTADADETARKVEANGGKVIAPPFDVLGQGRMAVFTDNTGAFFSVWQPMSMPGLGIKDEPNSFGWCELNTKGVDKAKEFYAAVLGWGSHQSSTSGDSPAYTEWTIGDQHIGGAMEIGAYPGMPTEIPPHWLVYFLTSDIEATAAKVTELGGTLQVPPTDYPGGKFAIATDNGGAAFGLMQGGESAG
jgi:predicted enzyme related to lactoylglutathione lyase